jgi:hypothetical protein
MDQHEIEALQEIDRLLHPLRRHRPPHHVAHRRHDQRLGPPRLRRLESGSSSKRSWVRPNGNCSVISTSGASARNRSSSSRVRAVLNASSIGAPSSRLSSRRPASRARSGGS